MSFLSIICKDVEAEVILSIRCVLNIGYNMAPSMVYVKQVVEETDDDASDEECFGYLDGANAVKAICGYCHEYTMTALTYCSKSVCLF